MSGESIVEILDIVSRLRTARTFQEKMDLICEGISACGWVRVHLYVFDRDRKTVKSAAYWGFDDEGKKYLESNRMTIEEIENILSNPDNQEFKIGRCYYVPHDTTNPFFVNLLSTGWVVEMETVEAGGWHPEDMMFVPLYGFHGKAMGIVSVDEPADGKRPTQASLRSVELFVDYATAFIEETELEEYLSKSKVMLSEVFNLSPVAIVASDENDNIIQINPAAEKMFGYSLDKIVGKGSTMLISPSENLDRIIQSKDTFKGEVMIRKADGKESWAYIVNVPVHNFSGGIEGYLLMALDVTEIKNLQYYLIRAEKIAGIGILASGIAHELNNPLYGILGLAEAIVEEDEVPVMKEYANDIVEYAREAAEIVKDLAGYTYTSRMETSSTVKVNLAIQNALKMIKRLGKLESVEITQELGDIPEVNASASELQQVFVNLITNAIDSMPNGGTLFLTTTKVGNFIEAKVRDTGTGIPEDLKAHMFEPFFTTKPIGEGTGLGLYICYRIVNKYMGTIDFESLPGKGTLFTVRFPLREQI